MLRDIASLANGGGGYLIIGIRDDGKGKAQTYASDLKLDSERVKKAITDLSHKYIVERLESLEVLARNVKGHPLVLVKVPYTDNVPHMITYNDTTGFYSRYHDGKRTMTIGEIREAFSQYAIGQSYDGLVFQQSQEILDDDSIEMLLQELEDSGEYEPDQREALEDFLTFLKDPQHEYVHRYLRASCNGLTNAIARLLAFFDTSYYDDPSGNFCLSIDPTAGIKYELHGENWDPEEDQKWKELDDQLQNKTQELRARYQIYRQVVKSVLLF